MRGSEAFGFQATSLGLAGRARVLRESADCLRERGLAALGSIVSELPVFTFFGAESLERGNALIEIVRRQMGITQRHLDGLMAQKRLDAAQVYACLDQT